MILESLKLLNFRNYENLELDFKTKNTVIVGENAQGKTNLIEAVYLLSSLESSRTIKDSETIRWGSESALINGIVKKDNGSVNELEVIIQTGKAKLLKLNKLKKSGYSDFIGNLSVVSFSVEDLLLLRGSPVDRRDWIDRAISQLYPAYYSKLQNYKKIHQQKSSLLKTLKKNELDLNPSTINMIDAWNEQISTSGSNIIFIRQKFLKELYPLSKEKTLQISGKKDNLSLAYVSSIGKTFALEPIDTTTVEEIKHFYTEKIKERFNDEIARGQVLIGPHRDDISICINNRDARQFASQGQHRTIVLALKLSELEFVKQTINEPPILILDDVLAELDLYRQKYLFESIANESQTIITTTDIKSLENNCLGEFSILTVHKGKINNG